MKQEEIKEKIRSIGKFYYYYNFEGNEVHKRAKHVKHRGLNNWEKLKTIFAPIFARFNEPLVVDMGCNMALLSHEMTKLGTKVIGVDLDLKMAQFFGRYIRENTSESWTVDLQQVDVVTEKIKRCKDANIITALGVIYWLEPNADRALGFWQEQMPKHEYLILQGNIRARKRTPLPLSTVDGMKKFVCSHGYRVDSVHEWNGYQKPIVVARRA